jgi:hypothetical protein
MKRSIMRVAIGVLGLGLVAGTTTGCTQKAQIPPDQMARLEAAANKAEAAANKADAAARSASDSAMRAEAAVAKIESGWRGHLHK